MLPFGIKGCAPLGYLLPHTDARLTGDQSEVAPLASRLTIGQQRYLRAIESLHERYGAGYADRTVVEFLPEGHPRGWRRRFRPRPDGSGMGDILTATEVEHVTGSEAVEDTSVEDPGSASDSELDSAVLAWPMQWRQASRNALDALATREAWPMPIRRRQASRNAPLDALAIREAWPMPYSRPAAADVVATTTALAAE